MRTRSTKLKFKFDEIFSVLKYTKALKSLKEKGKQKTLSTIKIAKLKLHELKNEVTVLNARKLEMEERAIGEFRGVVIFPKGHPVLSNRGKQMKELVTLYKMSGFIQIPLPYEKEVVN
ncbi:hypothetical protein ACTFIU_004085 [Dictyostelium citrinum]